MKQVERNGGRRGRERYPLATGLIVSALLHLLFVLLNPVTVAPSHGSAGSAPSTPGAQFTVLSLSPRDEDDVLRVDELPPDPPSPARTAGVSSATPGDTRDPGSGTGHNAGEALDVAERLRYRTRSVSPSIELPAEPANQRALREARERVARAGSALGPLPPNGVGGSRGGSGGASGGISIPFGFKPPPPAQTVPAPPLPDSILRRDSIRAATRAEAFRDSLRTARDTARLRNLAPRRRVIIPRVVPDTTAR